MLNGGSFRGLSLPKPVSVFLAVALTFCGITVLLPEEEVLVKAPLQSAGVLNVSWANVAPDTNTFQGDVNLSMVWLAFQALGADITLESIKVDTFGLPSQAINRTFLYDDYDGDKDMSFFECIIASDDSSPYILPPSGQLLECTGMNQGQPVVIKQNQTRYFTVYLDLDFDPQQKFTDRVLRACVDKGGITSSANITAGLNDSAACSRTIDVNRRFFYDGMERGQGNWTFLGGDEAGVHPDGLWHISRGEEDCINTGGNIPFYHTGNTSWWYGHRYNISTPLFVCDYYTFEPGNPSNSTRNWGKLRTPWIDARKGTNLAMVVWHYLSREPHPGVDLAQIYVNDGAGWHYVSNEWSTNGTWRKLNFNLSAYSGKELQFEFRFDTMDELNNQFLGWFIDDLVLYGEILDHDITLTNLNIGDYVSLDPQTVTARVSNVGKFDESNIQINLTQNGTTVDQRTVPSLLSGENTTVSLNWAPPGEGIYEICVRSLPVAGEIVLWNNYQCKSVNATSANSTRVVILRSYGTQANGPRNTWDYLNNNWGNYGLNPIQIDYTSLNTYPITYEAINDTQADVLVLSGSGYYGIEPAGTELDDSETVAIERWIREGHGFVTIGTAFDQQIPNNNDLVDLVGIIDQPYTLHFADDIQVESGCINHPIFNNVPDVFQNDFGYTMSPNNDLSWDMSDLDGGQICARSPGNGSATIVIFKGAVMISFAADVTPNENERQLLYNSFVWSRFQSLDYDVKVSDLRAPRYLRPSYPANISSLVSNIGRADLPETRVDLKVDGFIVDSKNLTDLGHGNRTHANFSWTPFSVGIYQICVFAEIVGFVDEDLSNNEACTSIEVMTNPPVQVYVLDSWGTDFASQAPWRELNANWANYGSVPVYIDYERFNKENIRYEELVDSYADVLLISSSRSGEMGNPAAAGYLFTPEEMSAIVRYTQEGHGLIATGLTFDSDKLPGHGAVLGPLFGMNASNTYTFLTGIHDMRILNPLENHPLFYRIPKNYTTAEGTTLTPGFFMTGSENWTSEQLAGGEYKALSYPNENASVIVYEHPNYTAVYITSFAEKNSNQEDRQLLYNAMVWGRTSVTAPTDLWIYKSGDTLRLEWVESTSPKVQGYRIYRATSVNGFTFDIAYDEVPAGTSQWVDPQPDAGIDSNSYFYIVRAFDRNGNDEQNLNKVGKFVKRLYRGYNDISIGFELKDNRTSVVFESVNGSYRYVEALDPATCMWKRWEASGVGDLTEINRSMGLRVRMQSNGLLINVGRVAFTRIVIPEASACGNWNFMGYPSFATKSLPGVLDNGGMAGKYDLVMYFDPTDKKAKWKFFDPNDPSGSTLKELFPGMGIWIHVIQAGIWEVKGD